MISKILGLADMLAVILISQTFRFNLEGNIFLIILLLLIFQKGALFTICNIKSGNYLGWMGYVDLAVSFFLFMMLVGNPISVPSIVMTVIFFKALYTMLLAIF